ncbi:MAG: tRNA (adenosine(37)-N6)-threonylcarbamoyltransferase complex transferase subunit TsaD [Flavobacteriales bacterium]|nr:tRNA (adenosine(37)-N6)-threonylcarbamoyltransferase complex transferase subunit TsaD [Flavobacteriales bacterium]MCW8912256.1 tRNA (adenosine(37)-N6)-threonylcarbamoyltransferase complex transferase subunit TsaD [Flavobacteriales bacterium]MCW8937505.1 tRNA (adenosine(37)-N6)-threonylcarbamoyltransferase complex transferase subunit TsaD [Flavobacteriales bacterium]MCW8940142.1 tRNA (adenosine(37)-N6)-threonylcarbamoyltransferase complex transferase subunit TsaD [Flavobacteriales bacterium]M
MHQSSTIILGIESSCDDTAAAVISNGKVLANIIANQEIHKKYGGVVPELASRAHQQNIVPVVDAALKKAGITKNDITAVAYTNGPGLLGSLLVGSSFAKTLSIGLNIPAIAVNHMQGHILAHFIQEQNEEKEMPEFPFLCLTVSGGHTQIVRVDGYFKMEVIGETIDDAAGEAFDKIAKMLQLPYPGGPLVDKYAKEGNPDRFSFPHPKVDELSFSFSGLKTSVLYFLQKEIKSNPNFITENIKDICAGVQKTIVDILISKLLKAVEKTNIKQVAIAGGVSANSGLRNALKSLETHEIKVFIPKFEYCTDNAAMIAITGYYHFLENNDFSKNYTPNARLKL